MKRELALTICNNLLVGSGQLAKHFKHLEVVGSIRRKRDDVNDIDIVAIPKPDSGYEFGEQSLGDRIKFLDSEGAALKNSTPARYLNGPKIKRFLYEGIMIDLYLVDKKTWGTLVLIRTGSKQHNIKLTTLAREKGYKIYAGGQGLCTIKGGIYNSEPEEIVEILEDTEDGILMNLLGSVPKPEDRTS